MKRKVCPGDWSPPSSPASSYCRESALDTLIEVNNSPLRDGSGVCKNEELEMKDGDTLCHYKDPKRPPVNVGTVAQGKLTNVLTEPNPETLMTLSEFVKKKRVADVPLRVDCHKLSMRSVTIDDVSKRVLYPCFDDRDTYFVMSEHEWQALGQDPDASNHLRYRARLENTRIHTL